MTEIEYPARGFNVEAPSNAERNPMTCTVLFHSDRFDWVSYGNGTAYALHDNVNKRFFFVQGDDASTLRDEIEAWEAIDPNKHYDEIFAYLMRAWD